MTTKGMGNWPPEVVSSGGPPFPIQYTSKWLGAQRKQTGREENCFAGGGMARKPICPTPPSPSLVAVPGGGFGLGLPYLPCRGGGGSDPNIHGSK